MWTTYFNDVQDNILVEAVQDTLGYAVVIPGSMDKQKILQVFELCERKTALITLKTAHIFKEKKKLELSLA